MVMALKLPIRLPFFAPPLDPNPNLNLNFTPTHQRPSTEVRFSRWNNANAEKFEQRRRTQEEIENEIRRQRRFEAVTNITNASADEASSTAVETFRSTGTPSAPSRPSIPGKKSKYSKDPPKPGLNSHPAFRFSNIPKSRPIPVRAAPPNVKMNEDGVSYVIDGAPFEFKYSYTETPKVKPIKMREPPFVPFGPATMPRPWTGRAPLPPSKKKLKEFDSFVLPPPHKKGVKPVQSPGPFLPGSSPKYVRSREEILGEPLTKDEINDLVKGCLKTNRQMNIGRDGLTHNMLDNIHAHWKRRRVCKIKCKGVCTVDMDNVCQQLEERTGGKIIYRRHGTLYLFRGRNYNYKTHPRFPLMLWKPVPPVYPRLIQRVPEGLSLEEATEMRQKGRNLIPICKLGKNGVYCNLVKNVREAFEECELVRINCQGLNPSDYRKIGAKLRDLVPCVLLSFEYEHIFIWRGRNWKSSLPDVTDDSKGANKIDVDSENDQALPSEAQEFSAPCVQKNSVEHVSDVSQDTSIASSSGDVTLDKVEVPYPTDDVASLTTTFEAETTKDITEPCGSTSPSMTLSEYNSHAKCPSETIGDGHGIVDIMDSKSCSDGLSSASISGSDAMQGTGDNSINGMVDPHADKLPDGSGPANASRPSRSAAPCTKEVLSLLDKAFEEGSALILDEESLDADNIYKTSVAFAKSAPPGPVFRLRRKVVVQKSDKQEGSNLETKETTTVAMKGGKEKEKEKEKKSSKIRRKENFDKQCLNVVPRGTLGVDELAKLLT